MSAQNQDVLIERTARDVQRHDSQSALTHMQEILRRDTDPRNPANRIPGHVTQQLMKDHEALHAATGLSHDLLQKLGFPDPLIEKARHDIQARDRAHLMQDLQQLLYRDADPTGKQLKVDHARLHAAGLPDDALVKLGFPMPNPPKPHGR